MPVRCPDCLELAYRHPTRRRGRICPLSPPQVYRRAQEWRDELRRSGAFTPEQARRLRPCAWCGKPSLGPFDPWGWCPRCQGHGTTAARA